MIKRYGSYEKWIESLRINGKVGGKNGNTGGFASDIVGNDGLTGYQRAKVAGRKGGTISRRGKKNETKN